MNLRPTILIALMLAVLSPLRLPAPLYQDGYDDAAAKALAANYSSSIGRPAFIVDGTPYFASGVFLNSRWFLTAAHLIANPTGTGDATVTGIYPGAVSGGPTMSASEVHLIPGYDGTGNTPDLALIRLVEEVNAPSLTLASASVGEVVISAGYGYYGSPSLGFIYPDHNARGWQASVTQNTLGGYSSDYYQSTSFSPFEGVASNGRGLGGDSGSPVFNASGQLVGISIASAGGLSSIGHTEFLRLTQPDVLNWIQTIITPVEPQIVSLTATNADVQLVWQGKGGSNYVVQASAALGGTNTFTDLSGVITLPGAGQVLTNFLDPGALTNSPTRFYRIQLN